MNLFFVASAMLSVMYLDSGSVHESRVATTDDSKRQSDFRTLSKVESATAETTPMGLLGIDTAAASGHQIDDW